MCACLYIHMYLFLDIYRHTRTNMDEHTYIHTCTHAPFIYVFVHNIRSKQQNMCCCRLVYVGVSLDDAGVMKSGV